MNSSLKNAGSRFKFRVWRYCHSLGAAKFYFLNFPKIAELSGANLCFIEEDTWHIEKNLMDAPRDCTVNQWTGLYDLHFKEIYEGDIVAFPLQPHHNGERRSVQLIPVIWELLHSDFNGSARDYFEHFEIIGNIHENPELIPEGEVSDETTP